MLETDAQSRRHLLFIVGFIAFLFGSFALWGTLERAAQRGTFGEIGIGAPAPVEPDRAAFLAERRVWFQTRKQMAALGRKSNWRGAVRVADTYLAKKDDGIIRSLRGEALLRLSDARGGTELAAGLRGGDENSSAEAGLMRGDSREFAREVRSTLEKTDEEKASPLDANNAAWLAAFAPAISDEKLLAKAASLAEKAVRAARAGDDPEVNAELATYMNTLGGVYFRAGRDDDAIKTLLESERLRTEPFNAAFLALAYRRAGDQKAARVWHDRLEQHLTRTFATRDGQSYRHQLLLLWRENVSTTQE